MSVFDLLPIAFKLIHRKDDILRAWELAQPAISEIRKVAPVLAPLVRDILKDIRPELEQTDWAPISYDTKWVQETLNLLGYGPLKTDGKMGPATEAAIRRFQETNGLKADGDPGPITRARLYVRRQEMA